MAPRPTPSRAAQPPSSSAIRLHVPDDLAAGASLIVSEAQAHYLLNVMRRRAGDAVRVFNGRDGEHAATLTDPKRARCVLTLGAQLRAQSPEADIWLAFALLKRGPTELIVQKATELGVAVLWPMFTTHTQADRTNIARFQAIATEASEQSERLSVPELHPPRALNAVLAAWPPGRRLIACLERTATAPIRPAAGAPAGLLIGPEGGFTDAELDGLRACPFVEPASLGPRVLRAETAAIVGLALLQSA